MNGMLISEMEPDVLFAKLLSLRGVTPRVGLQNPSNTTLRSGNGLDEDDASLLRLCPVWLLEPEMPGQWSLSLKALLTACRAPS